MPLNDLYLIGASIGQILPLESFSDYDVDIFIPRVGYCDTIINLEIGSLLAGGFRNTIVGGLHPRLA